MVHNGIEYGLMASYAEGFNVLRHANLGMQERSADAETTPLKQPELYRYELNLAEIAEVWRRGSVIASWLLDLTAQALYRDPSLPASAVESPIRVKVAGPWPPRLMKGSRLTS
jgi:6-phosphogluconate dehydrogenase